MKMYSKLVIIFIFVFGYANDLNINKHYIDELMNFKIELPQKIYNPFFIQKKEEKKVIKKEMPKIQIIEQKLYLLAILNNKALMKVSGLNIQKWLKEGEKIGKYKLVKIINNKSVLIKSDKKEKIITINNLNINIKVNR